MIDLVNLTNGQLQDLGSASVPAGTYHQMRLVLAGTGNSVTPIGGTAQALATPSGQHRRQRHGGREPDREFALDRGERYASR